MMATPQSAFQLPPHLLFPGYHASAAAAAAADAAYRQEMYKHRQSVDSAASAESLSRYTPPHVLRQQQQQLEQQQQHPTPMQTPTPEPVHPQPAASPIDVCLGADEDSHHLSPHSQHSQSPHSIIHTPVAIRASPSHAAISVSASASPTPTHSSSSSSPLSFAAKMQSLSPVSVCSIGGEETGAVRTATASAGPAAAQDGPMDLSMKTSRSSVHSFNDSDACSLQDEQESTLAPRRKFAQLEAEYSSSSHSSSSAATATATATASFSETKRQKMNGGEFGSFAATSAMRGIFVCV